MDWETVRQDECGNEEARQNQVWHPNGMDIPNNQNQ